MFEQREIVEPSQRVCFALIDEKKSPCELIDVASSVPEIEFSRLNCSLDPFNPLSDCSPLPAEFGNGALGKQHSFAGGRTHCFSCRFLNCAGGQAVDPKMQNTQQSSVVER
jgi:hypothetical protein